MPPSLNLYQDLVENIEPGVAQHMGDNVLAVLLHLASPESPLPHLTEGFSRPKTVFYQLLGVFIIYSFRTATFLYLVLFVASSVLVWATYVDPAPALKQKSVLAEHVKSAAAVAAAVVGAAVGANVVAFLMAGVLGKNLSWFSSERACIFLYAPAALSGTSRTCYVLTPAYSSTLAQALCCRNCCLADCASGQHSHL